MSYDYWYDDAYGYDDYLSVEGDNNTLYGGSGNDELVVGRGKGNRLYGDEGDDVLNGGAGNDILDGGVGFWVTNFTLLCLEVNISFELGNLLAEVFHNNGGIDWINIH